jgi:hypothetical protein
MYRGGKLNNFPQVVLKDTKRYPRIAEEMACVILVYGTKKQAEIIAERLSNYYAGCNELFYLEDWGPEG